MIEVNVALGEDVAVSVGTDASYSPDVLDDVLSRAITAAVSALAAIRGDGK